MPRPRSLALALATIALGCLVAPASAVGGEGGSAGGEGESVGGQGEPAGGEGESAAQRLVETYAPILELRAQEDPPCDTNEEQYEATTVDTVLGNPSVRLIGPAPGDDGGEATLERGPTAADVAGLGEEHHLDLNGQPLGDTCIYARDFAALKREGKAPPITYAHVARESGRPGLVVQYWFFWYFNQFNDLHEGDWEGMQLAFEASDPELALQEGPREIALYQHAGGEKARWEDGKVEKDETHPVVYPAAGSHATFYESAVYVENGRRGSGVGCDNTSAPHRRLEVRPVLVPDRPSPQGRFRWLTFEGRWGQKEKGFNNGPTGPATKDRWHEPLTWMDDVRSTSPRLPAGSVLGPTVTKAFCGAVSDVTSFLNHAQDRPWLLFAVPAALLLALALLVWRTRWRPVDVEELRGRRAFGQLLATSARLYERHWRAFAPIGLSAFPIVGGLTALSWLFTGDTGRRLDTSTGVDGLHVAIGELIAGIGQPVAAAVVAAAVIVAVRQLVEGGETGFGAAYRGMWRRFRRVVGAQLLGTLALIAMAVSVVGLPFAAWKYVGWLFIQQQILFEDRSAREAFRGSSELVRGRWWYTLRVAAVLGLLGVVAGPALGFALIFTTLPLALINAIGSIVFALLIPYVAIGQTLLYFDLQARPREAPARRRLPWRRRPGRPAAAQADM